MRPYHPNDFKPGARYRLGNRGDAVYEFQSFTTVVAADGLRDLFMVFEQVDPRPPNKEFIVRYVPITVQLEAEELL